MPDLPSIDSSDDEWHEFAKQCCEDLAPHLARYLARFAYKPRYIQQNLHRSFATVCARTKKYDLYVRMFIRPDDFWPRECLVLARIGFKEQRTGHGRALIELLVELAPTFGYRYLAIECANAKAGAFAERLGFTPYDNRRHWVGAVEAIQDALSQHMA